MWRTILISISLCLSIKETIGFWTFGSKRRGMKGKERDGQKKKKKKKKNRAWVKFLERSNTLKNTCNFHNIFIIISKKFMYMFGFNVCAFHVYTFPFFFFFFWCTCFIVSGDIEHCSRDPQPLYSEKNIKNGSYNTIHTFKNYFATVFSVFSFQQNKLYSNEPYMCQAVTSFNLCSLLTSLFLPNNDNL